MRMGTMGRAVGFDSCDTRMTLEHWGKTKVVEAQIDSR